MRKNEEYELCKAIATYIRLQYPGIMHHYDLAGLNLSMAQAGMMKAIQGQRGFPDLFILEPRGVYHGLFLEVKKEKTKLRKRDGYTPATPHIEEQIIMREDLLKRGYMCEFGIGFQECKEIIDNYLNL